MKVGCLPVCLYIVLVAGLTAHAQQIQSSMHHQTATPEGRSGPQPGGQAQGSYRTPEPLPSGRTDVPTTQGRTINPQYPYPPYHNPYYEGPSPGRSITNALEWVLGIPTAIVDRVADMVDAKFFPKIPAAHGGKPNPESPAPRSEPVPSSSPDAGKQPLDKRLGP
ncbi:MAG: hypothetical protein V2B18_04395 [Pseudomonadota bacterium]